MDRKVTKAEFDAHIQAWPRKLERNVFGAGEPPRVTYNDFAYGDWPDSVVASFFLPGAGDSGPTDWTIHREIPDASDA